MIEQLLDGADRVVAGAAHCWLMTESPRGRVHARPMSRIGPSPGQADWTISFLADSRSRKVQDLQAAADARLIFELEERAFVNLAGPAHLIADAASIEPRWRAVYDAHFPTDADRVHAVFIDVRAEEMRLWIRGLTPEPFGLRSVTLHRDFHGGWQLRGDRGANGETAHD